MVAGAQAWAMDPARLRRAAAWFCGVVVVVPQAISIAIGLRGKEIDLVVYSKYLVLAAMLAAVTLSDVNLPTNYRRTAPAGRRQEWLGARLGLSPRTGGIVTGVALGLAFEPLRTRTSAFVERRLERFSEPDALVAPRPAGTVPA